MTFRVRDDIGEHKKPRNYHVLPCVASDPRAESLERIEVRPQLLAPAVVIPAGGNEGVLSHAAPRSVEGTQPLTARGHDFLRVFAHRFDDRLDPDPFIGGVRATLVVQTRHVLAAGMVQADELPLRVEHRAS